MHRTRNKTRDIEEVDALKWKKKRKKRNCG